MLRVPATLGRVVTDERNREAVVISDRFWRERFDAQVSVLGESLRIGSAAFVVAGAVPRECQGLSSQISVPISMLSMAVPIANCRPSVDVVGRVSAGVGVSESSHG